MILERPEFKGRPFGAWEAEAFKGLTIEKMVDITDQASFDSQYEILLGYTTLRDKKLVEVIDQAIGKDQPHFGLHFFIDQIEEENSSVLEIIKSFEKTYNIRAGLLTEIILTHAREEGFS